MVPPVASMSKSSGRSLANGNSTPRTSNIKTIAPRTPPVPTIVATAVTTTAATTATRKPRKPRATPKQPTSRLDSVDQTIEDVIAHSLLESQKRPSCEWTAKNQQQPSSSIKPKAMRQKRLPQKRKSMPNTTAAVMSIKNGDQSEPPTTSTTTLPLDKALCNSLDLTSVTNGKQQPAGLTNGKSSSPAGTPPVRILPKPSPVTVIPTTLATKRGSMVPGIVPTDKLSGLLAKKRKWTTELSPDRSSEKGGSGLVPAERHPSPTRKIDTGHHNNVPVTKKRKLEALMHRRGQKSVWAWRGKSFIKTVYSKVEKRNMERTCYNAVKHDEGEVIKVGDCVLLRAPKGQEPHIGKVAAFWADERGDMMMTIFWFWRPEEVDISIRPAHGAMEVYVSSLRDENFVSCIDEKCFVLTAHQYARFMALSKDDDTLYHRPKRPFVPSINSPINTLLPEVEIDPEIVYFADKGFDGKSNRFWDYYFRGSKLRKCYLD